MCECGQPPYGASPKCKRCYYLAVLGLDRTATPETIKSTWRAEIRKVHPDKAHPSEDKRRLANERSAELNIAHDVLLKGARGNVPKARRTSPDASPRSSAGETTTGSRTSGKVPPQNRQSPDQGPSSQSRRPPAGARPSASPPPPRPATESRPQPEPWKPDYSRPSRPALVPKVLERLGPALRTPFRLGIALVAVLSLATGVRAVYSYVLQASRSAEPAAASLTVCTADTSPYTCGCTMAGRLYPGQEMQVMVDAPGPIPVTLVLPDHVLKLPDKAHPWKQGLHDSCISVPYRIPAGAKDSLTSTLSWTQDGVFRSRQTDIYIRTRAAPAKPR